MRTRTKVVAATAAASGALALGAPLAASAELDSPDVTVGKGVLDKLQGATPLTGSSAGDRNAAEDRAGTDASERSAGSNGIGESVNEGVAGLQESVEEGVQEGAGGSGVLGTPASVEIR